MKQASYDASASQQELFSTQQQQQQQQRQRKVKAVPHNAETHNLERVNTVHYYEYIQAQPNSSNSPERTPLPIPNMTENVSYGQAPVRSDSNERYNTSPSTLNRNDSQRPVESGTNWSGKSYEEEREGYVSINPKLPSSANSSQMVMYI